MILILGASGYIGNNLYNKFTEERFDVAGTYSKNKISGLVYFDIRNMNLDEIKLDKKIHYIIIASGININIDNYKEELNKIKDIKGLNKREGKDKLGEDLKELENNMAVGYAYEKGRFTAKPFEIIYSFGPAGAMSTTSTDIANFSLAFLNGGSYQGKYNVDGKNYTNRILQEATVTEMLTQNFSHDSRIPGMALGFYESVINGNRLVGHGGNTQYFHSNLAIDLENDLAIFVSFSGTAGAKVTSIIVPAFYNEFFPVDLAPLSISEDFNERANRYAGSYLFWRSNFSTIEKVFKKKINFVS